MEAKMKRSAKMIVSSVIFGAIIFLTQSCGKDTASKSAKGKSVTTNTTSKADGQATSKQGGTNTTQNAGTTGGVQGVTNSSGTTSSELPVSSPGTSSGGAATVCVDSDNEESAGSVPEPVDEIPDDAYPCYKKGANWECENAVDHKIHLVPVTSANDFAGYPCP